MYRFSKQETLRLTDDEVEILQEFIVEDNERQKKETKSIKKPRKR